MIVCCVVSSMGRHKIEQQKGVKCYRSCQDNSVGVGDGILTYAVHCQNTMCANMCLLYECRESGPTRHSLTHKLNIFHPHWYSENKTVQKHPEDAAPCCRTLSKLEKRDNFPLISQYKFSAGSGLVF